SYFVFFFQAEDGIRDFHVTGVQTCALPISRSPSRPTVSSLPNSASCRSTPIGTRDSRVESLRLGATRFFQRQENSVIDPTGQPRSEERRVGKEMRARGEADHQKQEVNKHR